jgi:RHS repeat-associated protein
VGLITAPSPDGTAPQPVTTFAYDYRGRRTSVTDANNKTTTYAYDDADRLTSVTDAASNVTTYAYDTENNLTSITDASSRTTYFEYDAFGRVTEVNFPSTLIETYAYDAVGNLTSKTDRKNQTINYVYDALDRLVTKTYPDSSQVEYVYDLVGKVQQVNDPTGTYGFAYDNMGRLVGTTTSYSFLTSRTFTVGYTYDKNSNRTQMTDPEGGSTTYAYDVLDGLTSITNFQSQQFTFAYDALGRRTQLTRPNGVNTTYQYDSLSRLLSVVHRFGANILDGTSYAVDGIGNRIAKTDLPANITSTYTYDPLYQLAQVVRSGQTTETYSHDPAGNRLSDVTGATYSYNASNYLVSAGGTTFGYDANGSVLSKVDSSGTTGYSWDYENRLASLTLPGGAVVSFRYDPMGRRISKTLGSNVRVYVYDGEDIIEEVDGSGLVIARYTHGLDVDEPLASVENGANYYFAADGLGSITSATDSTGSVLTSFGYDAFGKLQVTGPNLVSPFRFTGRDFDSETGSYFYRARYYDPAMGRFLSEDPIQFAGGDNFYSYVHNSPTNLYDPTGLKAFACCRRLKGDDRDGNFFQDIWRFLKRRAARATFQRHCFIDIVPDDGSEPVTYGLNQDLDTGLGVIRKNHPTDTVKNRSKDCKEVNPKKSCESADSRERQLREHLEDLFNEQGKGLPTALCISCGDRYRRRGPNSNTFVYEQLLFGGYQPPKLSRAPGYKHPRHFR